MDLADEIAEVEEVPDIEDFLATDDDPVDIEVIKGPGPEDETDVDNDDDVFAITVPAMTFIAHREHSSDTSSDNGVESIPSSAGPSLPPSRGEKRKGSWENISEAQALMMTMGRSESLEVVDRRESGSCPSPAWSDVPSVEEVVFSDSEPASDWAQMMVSIAQLKNARDEQDNGDGNNGARLIKSPSSDGSGGDDDHEFWSPLVTTLCSSFLLFCKIVKA
jgi:hypothetical protein